ncbi:MAG: phosphotransferase [Chloroflexi bacterium]|nr:phosphotransferase [Chloroflexota bacterium]
MPADPGAEPIAPPDASYDTSLAALGLAGEPVLLRDGPDALVVRDADAGRVLHLPKHAAAAAAHARRVQIMPYLRGHLSPAIPLPQPRPAAGVSPGTVDAAWLPGRPLTPGAIDERSEARLARSLGRFLAELHAYSAERAQALGAPGPRDRRDFLEGLRDRSLRALRPQLGASRTARLRRWWRTYLADEAAPYDAAPTHGQIAPEHLLLDEEGHDLQAVLGWSGLTVADPALDLAAVAPHYGTDFAWLVMEAYRAEGGAVDAGFLRRVRRQAGVLPFLAWDRSRAPGDAAPAAATAALAERLRDDSAPAG